MLGSKKMRNKGSRGLLPLFAAMVPLALVVIVACLCKQSAPLAGGGTVGFRDAAVESGIDFHMSFLPDEQGAEFKANLYDHGCGLAVADYDRDGHEDVLFLNQLGCNALFRNKGDGTFERVTAESDPLAMNDRICVGAAFGDYDNDGDQDLYITTTRGGNALFENADGVFRDVTQRAGVACTAHSQTPAFFDYDRDGDLDLFVTNSARWTEHEFDESQQYFRGTDNIMRNFHERELEKNILFRNEGGGKFSDATAAAGLAGKGWSGDVALIDYDQDGDPDLLVTNMYGMSQLYENDGSGHFTDVTRQTLERVSMGAIGTKAFDYNNDGRLDLFIADMHSDMWIGYGERWLVEPARKYRRRLGPRAEADPRVGEAEKRYSDQMGVDYERLVFGNTFFRNEGGGRFTERSDEARMETFWPWGVADGDFDNDGYVDIFLPSGMGYPYFYWPSSLLMNAGDGTFVDRADTVGIEPPPGGRLLPDRIDGQSACRSSRCAVTADFDGDGRLDIMVNNFNDRPYYFKNRFPRRHYVAFRLRGVRSNRDAVGAVVTVELGRDVLVRQVNCAGGYLSQSSQTLHFGLGDAERLDHVLIRWPSGIEQTLGPLEVDRLHEIVEPTS